MFNPAALLPGAAHPKLSKMVEKEDSVDFDEPPEAETLSSAAKVGVNCKQEIENLFLVYIYTNQ